MFIGMEDGKMSHQGLRGDEKLWNTYPTEQDTECIREMQ